jgi:Ca-activated chloride channel family protein
MSMRIFAPIAVAALLIVPMRAQEPQRKFKVSTNSVALYATVTDTAKRLVPDLVEDDFEVYDNGKLQTLTAFDNKPLPITVVVMLDTSGSMTLALDLVKSAAEQFLLRMMPEDQGMVGAFNDKIEFHPEGFTNSRDELIRSLKDLDFGYPTRLYDAVNQSMTQLKGIPGRRVVLVFTDGDDNASKFGSGDVTDRGRMEDVMVYSIGLVMRFLEGLRCTVSSPFWG